MKRDLVIVAAVATVGLLAYLRGYGDGYDAYPAGHSR